VAAAPPTALTDTASAFDELALTPFQPVTLVSLPAASPSADTSDLKLPNADTLDVGERRLLLQTTGLGDRQLDGIHRGLDQRIDIDVTAQTDAE